MGVITKTGGGFTDLPGNGNNGAESRSVQKDNPLIECLGTLDELDAFLSLCEIALKPDGGSRAADIVAEVRKKLFTAIMPGVAGYLSADTKRSITETENIALNTAWIEQQTAKLEKETPVQGFVRTWTKSTAAVLNTARTVCRRSERRMITAMAQAAVFDNEVEEPKNKKIRTALFAWINRLSDLLFFLAVSEERRQ